MPMNNNSNRMPAHSMFAGGPCKDDLIQRLGASYQDNSLYFQKDKTGDRTGEVLAGSYLDMNGTDNSIEFSDLSGVTIVNSVGTSMLGISGNDVTATAGTIEYLELSNGAKFWFDEKDGADIFDVSGLGFNGTIGGTLTAIRQESADIYSYNNEFGYNDNAGQLIPANQSNLSLDVIGNTLVNKGQVGYDAQLVDSNVTSFNGTDNSVLVDCVCIPATDDFKLSITVAPNTIGVNQNIVSQYLGGAEGRIQMFFTSTNKIRVFMGSSAGNLDIEGGVVALGEYIDVELERVGSQFFIRIDGVQVATGTTTGTIYQGVNTLIGGYDAGGLPTRLHGNISSFEMEGGVKFTCASGNGAILYDVSGNGKNGAIAGTLTNLWDTYNGRPDNLFDGFDLWQNDSDSSYLYIPFDSAGNSIKTDGDTITGYTWVSNNPGIGETGKGHNRAETCYKQPAVNELIDVDNQFTTPIWFSSLVPESVCYDDIVANYENANLWMTNTLDDILKKDWVVYSNPISGDCLTKTEKYLKQ